MLLKLCNKKKILKGKYTFLTYLVKAFTIFKLNVYNNLFVYTLRKLNNIWD